MHIVERLAWFERDEDARANLPPGLFLMVRQAREEIERLQMLLREAVNDTDTRDVMGEDWWDRAINALPDWQKRAAEV